MFKKVCSQDVQKITFEEREKKDQLLQNESAIIVDIIRSVEPNHFITT